MIYVHNLWKSYKKTDVLKGLSLHIPAQQVMIILGRSGVGKSVLLRQIAGLEKPDRGHIEVDGVRLVAKSSRQHIGMLFQSSALFDSMTVGENVGFYLAEHTAIPKSERDDLIDTALKKVGLNGFQWRLPSELSGGQKRRAALARLIVYKPKIMLYDEPTTGLDPVTAAQINELIAETHRELKATTLVVTHDIQSALFLGDSFALHHDGQIACVEEKERFLQSSNPLIREFLQNAFVSQKYMTLFDKRNGSSCVTT